MDEKLEEKLKYRDHNLIAMMDQKFEENVQKLEGKLKILDKVETFSISKTTLGIICIMIPTDNLFYKF